MDRHHQPKIAALGSLIKARDRLCGEHLHYARRTLRSRDRRNRLSYLATLLNARRRSPRLAARTIP
jgi:hypothetical protein